MSAVWTPPHVEREHAATTATWEADVLAAMRRDGPVIDYWNTELRKIDDELRLMQAGERATVAGVVAGFYHLVRLPSRLRQEMLMVVPLRDPTNGGFVEPSSQMLDALRMCDLQNAQVQRARDEQLLKDKAAELRAIVREDQAREDEGVERIKAASRTQVLMSPDVPWSQNNSAAARRDRGQKRR